MNEIVRHNSKDKLSKRSLNNSIGSKMNIIFDKNKKKRKNNTQ